jgi:hypothetical protein
MPNPLFASAKEIQDFILARNWDFCFIGGIAVLRWGEIRMTQDVDLCLRAGFGNEKKYIDGFLENFTARIPDAGDFARKHRVLLLRSSSHVAIDIAFSGLDFETRMIERATFFPFEEGIQLKTCNAEELIILKAFADRPQDWLDVEGILARQGKAIDRHYCLEMLSHLCLARDNSDIVDRFKQLMDRG